VIREPTDPVRCASQPFWLAWHHNIATDGIARTISRAAESDAAETAGNRFDQEVRFDTGVVCDVVIYGPTANVDIEVQRYRLKHRVYKGGLSKP
jgi:hypothetical protein